MKKDRTGIIFLAIALVGFILVKVVPMVYTPLPTHDTGKVKIKKPQKPTKDLTFEKHGVAWFKGGDKANQVVIDIEIADKQYAITKGLMDRPNMDEKKGMLFVFKNEEPRSFWMKNTMFALDIIYIRKNGTIDSFYKNTTPYSINPLPSSGAVMYVLEVNGGFMDKYKIDKNSRFDFNKLEK